QLSGKICSAAYKRHEADRLQRLLQKLVATAAHDHELLLAVLPYWNDHACVLAHLRVQRFRQRFGTGGYQNRIERAISRQAEHIILRLAHPHIAIAEMGESSAREPIQGRYALNRIDIGYELGQHRRL